MAIIDASYFVADLTIAQKSATGVASSLDSLIVDKESELLTDLLGYELYRDLLSGLEQPTVEQKWADLLYGKEYTDRSSILRKYMGLTSAPSSILANFYWPDDIEVEVGSGDDHAPAAGTREYHNPFLTGKQFRVYRRGTGQLSANDITKVSDGFVMTASPTAWVSGEIFFIQFTAPAPLTGPATVTTPAVKKSPIANYVYWHWLQNEATSTTGTGEKVADNQNSVNASPGNKMIRAWNQMVKWNWDLIEFLLSNGDVYPQFQNHYSRIPKGILKQQNLFGI